MVPRVLNFACLKEISVEDGDNKMTTKGRQETWVEPSTSKNCETKVVLSCQVSFIKWDVADELQNLH